MRLVRSIADLLTGWWRAWIAALGGENQRTMRAAYREAYEPREGETNRLP